MFYHFIRQFRIKGMGFNLPEKSKNTKQLINNLRADIDQKKWKLNRNIKSNKLKVMIGFYFNKVNRKNNLQKTKRGNKALQNHPSLKGKSFTNLNKINSIFLHQLLRPSLQILIIMILEKVNILIQ